MSIETPILEVATQHISLEDCSSPYISDDQMLALQEQTVSITDNKIRTANSDVRLTILEPAQRVDYPTIVVANGLVAPKEAYVPYATELAVRGYKVALIKPPRTQDIRSSFHPKHLKDVLLLQAQGTWAAMKEIDEDSYCLYGHSTGAATNARVAADKSSRVDSLITAGGAGMNGRNSVIGMGIKTTGVVRDVIIGRRNLRREAAPHLASKVMYHAMRRPDRTAREAVTVAIEDSTALLDRAKRANVKIKIGCMLFGDDRYYSPDSVLAKTGHLIDIVGVIPGATHTHPQDHPIPHAHETAAMARALRDLTPYQKSA